MSHRKVYSQGCIPFSWEDSPGVSKAADRQYYPIDIGLRTLNLSSISQSAETKTTSFYCDDNSETKIPPPPPCPKLQPPRRSTSSKGWLEDDPFLAAYKQCTKNVSNNDGKLVKHNQTKKNNVGFKVGRSTKLMFSCKNSCDVEVDNLVRISGTLPPIPRPRFRGR